MKQAPILEPGVVYVWDYDFSQSVKEDALSSLLSPLESDRAARFHFAKDRRRFTLVHGAVQSTTPA